MLDYSERKLDITLLDISRLQAMSEGDVITGECLLWRASLDKGEYSTWIDGENDIFSGSVDNIINYIKSKSSKV